MLHVALRYRWGP